MRTNQTLLVTLIFVAFTAHNTTSQQNHLDVEGHAKIRGNIDISHMDDTTSVYIGRNTGLNIDLTGIRSNTFVGSSAGLKNSTGFVNAFFGRKAGKDNTTGSNNSFFGMNSGRDNTTGFSNSFFGTAAGRNNTTGFANSFFGVLTGGANTTGESNSFFGTNAGIGNTTGDFNSFFGQQAGTNNTAGSFNSFIGRHAGVNNRTGTRNTFIGHSADQLTIDSLDRAIAIGFNAQVNCSHCAVIGGIGEDTVNVGINTTTPEEKLHIKDGNLRVDNGEFQSIGIIKLHPDTDLSGDDIIEFLNSNGDELARFHQNGNFGVATINPTHVLHVDGIARSVQAMWATGSDIRVKKNIVGIREAKNLLERFRPVTFTWSEEYNSSNNEKQYGFIAQEVERVVPEMVTIIEEKVGDKIISDFRILNTSALTPILVRAFQELSDRVDNQQAEIKALRNQVSKMSTLKKEMNELRALLTSPVEESVEER